MTGVLEAWSALNDPAQGGGWGRFQWAWPWGLLALLPVLLALGAMVLQNRRRPAFRFSRQDVTRGLPPSAALVLQPLPSILIGTGLVLAALCVARPQVEGAVLPEDTQGVDIVISLDLSTSMRAADFKPKDRLFVAKEVISDFIMSRKNDRIGLVVFARDAFTQAPLTLDYMLLRNLIQELKTGVIEDGTAIGNGLAVALNRLRDSKAKSRVVILVTDGDNNAGQIAPEQAAEIAQKMGVKVFTVLVGRGGKVPYPSGQDLFGNPTYEMVELPVNVPLLRQIATVTAGQMFLAADREGLVQSFAEILDQMDRTKLEDARGRARPVDVFPLLLWPAVLLLFLGLLLEHTRLLRVLG
ncbi:MAG: VWA domain-containing protein [Deltaproteobacteria bacterium]|nr:VWA domain-containing protein [Deltaproteobacteria bacterium]